MRFTVGKGRNAVRFFRAERHTAMWDRQKLGFRSLLGFPR